MRPLYLLLTFTLSYSIRLFYKRFVAVNGKQAMFGRTIYVSNHPNSFMDPLVIGIANRPVLHFMTRSDVFKWWLTPVTWASHMLPIYRQHDGANTKNANQDSFREVNRSLRKGRNILIFGEGFTDDLPIRGLKPVKKGAVRMGFQALTALDWSKNIYVCPVGVNYTDRNTIGSEFLTVTGDKICLNDYRSDYEATPNKVINEVTKLLEKRMQECITYVKDKNWYSLHENVMQITRKGMNHQNHDDSIPLKERWNYSRKLANWMNERNLDENEVFIALKKDLEAYFSLEKRMKLEDRFVVAQQQPELKNRTKELLTLLLVWPFAIVGMVHGLVPYLLVKKFVEKSFGRKVFWGSVKMMLGKLVGTIWNIPVIMAITHFFFPYQWMGWVYFFIVPLFCLAAYKYMFALREFRIKGAMGKLDVSTFTARREDLVKRIRELIPVA